MKKNLFEKRIPTFLALVILLVGLSTTLLLVKNGIFIVSRASPNQDPQNVKVVNITKTSFTVVFTTLDPASTGVAVDNSPSGVFFDDRDKTGVKTFSSHFITIDNLNPQTKYSFSILSNGKTYLQNGNKYEASTAPGATGETTNQILTGTVLLPDSSPGSDVLILASAGGTNEAAAVTDDQGKFSLSADLFTDLNTFQPFSLHVGQQIDLLAIQGNNTSKVAYSFQEDGKIPIISLSSNYSFIASTQESEVGTASSNLKLPTGSKLPPKIKINVPKDNETFTDQRPQFQGVAVPNSIVKITIHSSNVIQIQVRADPNGNWSYRPSVSLSVGPHTITIETIDQTGILKTLTSSFTVFAAGSQIAENATPSATPTTVVTATPTPTPTVTPTPTTATATTTPAAVTNTPTPTITEASPSATLTPTPTDIPTPTPTVIAVAPPKSQPPPSGDLTHTIFLTTASILFIVAGSTLFFIL